MFRRTLVSVVALSVLATSCRFFRPINPSAPTQTQPKAAPKPAATQPKTENKPAPAKTETKTAAKTETKAEERVKPNAPGSVNDANIAAMVLASNNTDISYAKLVPTRAERTDIKEFAQRMLTDHTGVNGLVTDLLAKLDLAAEDNIASLDMRDESANKRDMMRELSGYAFDSTYIENEVSYHRKFLASIDNVMLPKARNSQLKSLLTAVRPAVAAHLAHAEQVRANVLSRK
jgi:putative membrane protein